MVFSVIHTQLKESALMGWCSHSGCGESINRREKMSSGRSLVVPRTQIKWAWGSRKLAEDSEAGRMRGRRRFPVRPYCRESIRDSRQKMKKQNNVVNTDTAQNRKVSWSDEGREDTKGWRKLRPHLHSRAMQTKRLFLVNVTLWNDIFIWTESRTQAKNKMELQFLEFALDEFPSKISILPH